MRTKSSKPTARTSIGIKPKTKGRLRLAKAPGQSYDGFVVQMVDLWEKVRNGE